MNANGHEGICFYVQSLFLEERTGISVSAVDLLIYVINYPYVELDSDPKGQSVRPAEILFRRWYIRDVRGHVVLAELLPRAKLSQFKASV
jgi:hypothetical protein